MTDKVIVVLSVIILGFILIPAFAQTVMVQGYTFTAISNSAVNITTPENTTITRSLTQLNAQYNQHYAKDQADRQTLFLDDRQITADSIAINTAMNVTSQYNGT